MMQSSYAPLFQPRQAPESQDDGRASDEAFSIDAPHAAALLVVEEEECKETVLTVMLESGDWASALTRISSHPCEIRTLHAHCRTPLHLACDVDAPAVVIAGLVQAYPQACARVGTSGMTPLHLTCSSAHASIHVVRVLLELGDVAAQCSLPDLDGDTPLHAACRSGAPLEVLEVLLQAYPAAVNERDYEGLTPLSRLWVRYVVMLGEDALANIRCEADLTGDLGQAWCKTQVLLEYAHRESLRRSDGAELQPQQQHQDVATLVVHAAASVDCPRAVVQIAARVYSHALAVRDHEGLTPLLRAAAAPLYKVRDLSDDGYLLEDVVHGDTDDDASGASHRLDDDEADSPQAPAQPSVIEILLQANQELPCAGASLPDPHGRRPLHVALAMGKHWDQGVSHLVQVYPEALAAMDPVKRLFPFMLAAAQGKASSDLDTIYQLLRCSPSVVEDVRTGKLTAETKGRRRTHA